MGLTVKLTTREPENNLRTEKDKNDEAIWFLSFKILVTLLAIVGCSLLWTVFYQWSLLSKLLSCAGLLIVLSISFTVSMMETAARWSSETKPSVFNISSTLNVLIALIWLIVFASAVIFAYKGIDWKSFMF